MYDQFLRKLPVLLLNENKMIIIVQFSVYNLIAEKMHNYSLDRLSSPSFYSIAIDLNTVNL